MEICLLVKKNKFRINYKVLFYNIIFTFFVFFSYNVLRNLEYKFFNVFISLLFNFLIFLLSIFNLKKFNIKENKIKFIIMIMKWIFLSLFLNIMTELIIIKNILHLKSISLDFVNLIYLLFSLIFLLFLNFINIYKNFYYFSFNILFFSYLVTFLHYKLFYIFTLENNNSYNIYLNFNILLITEFIILFIIFIIRIIYNKIKDIVKYSI